MGEILPKLGETFPLVAAVAAQSPMPSVAKEVKAEGKHATGNGDIWAAMAVVEGDNAEGMAGLTL